MHDATTNVANVITKQWLAGGVGSGTVAISSNDGPTIRADLIILGGSLCSSRWAASDDIVIQRPPRAHIAP